MSHQNTIKPYIPSLLSWYEQNRRSFPFRENPTPYMTWVSEIMLQQTRMEAVLPHYTQFMKTFPTIQDLASAPEALLLKTWEGLGYYSRARNLQKAAKIVVEKYHGELPKDFKELLSLPGIGEYTAGAIASISYQIPVPAIDGNVLRVFARLTNFSKNVLIPSSKTALTNVVCSVLPNDCPGTFNEAIMELGETICLPNGKPHCDICPLSPICEAFQLGKEESLPIREKKQTRRSEQRNVYIIITKETTPHILLHKRPSKGLLANMWEFPNYLFKDSNNLYMNFPNLSKIPEKHLLTCHHLFSHIEWKMNGYYIQCDPFPIQEDYVWANLNEIKNTYALPSAFQAFTKWILNEVKE